MRPDGHPHAVPVWYVWDGHSGARANVMSEGDNLYRVDVRRIMCWEYGAVNTRTDWKPSE